MLSEANKYKYINPFKEIPQNSTKKIYHYTSPEGLYGIIENSSLRFSDIQFLNDKSEYNHISKPLKIAFNELKESIPFDYDEILYYIDKQYETTVYKILSGSGWNTKFGFTDMKHYVFCASKVEDSLGMWNYYVKNGKYQGYNIGITVNQFLSCFKLIEEPKIKILYGDVIYNEYEQVKVLSKLLVDVSNKFKEKVKKIENQQYRVDDEDAERRIASQECIGEILYNIDSLRLFFKDNAFRNEEEFRFVIKAPRDYSPIKTGKLKTGFTIKQGIITPYCDLEIDKKKTVNSIMVSPIMEGDLAKRGLERVLRYYDYNKDIKIHQSNIPIRY